MTASQSNDGDFRSIPVTRQLRNKLRVEKAREGMSYDDYLRENLPLTE